MTTSAGTRAKTTIPYYMVDAVVFAPFGAYPGGVQGLYEMDFEHFGEYNTLERQGRLEEYLDKYVYSVGSNDGDAGEAGGARAAQWPAPARDHSRGLPVTAAAVIERARERVGAGDASRDPLPAFRGRGRRPGTDAARRNLPELKR